MTNIEKVAQILSTEPGQKAFIEWASSDITQRMLAAARELTTPSLPTSSDAGAIGLALGRTLGATAVVEYLTNPFRERVETGLTPMYGADEIIKESEYA